MVVVKNKIYCRVLDAKWFVRGSEVTACRYAEHCTRVDRHLCEGELMMGGDTTHPTQVGFCWHMIRFAKGFSYEVKIKGVEVEVKYTGLHR